MMLCKCQYRLTVCMTLTNLALRLFPHNRDIDSCSQINTLLDSFVCLCGSCLIWVFLPLSLCCFAEDGVLPEDSLTEEQKRKLTLPQEQLNSMSLGTLLPADNTIVARRDRWVMWGGDSTLHRRQIIQTAFVFWPAMSSSAVRLFECLFPSLVAVNHTRGNSSHFLSVFVSCCLIAAQAMSFVREQLDIRLPPEEEASHLCFSCYCAANMQRSLSSLMSTFPRLMRCTNKHRLQYRGSSYSVRLFRQCFGGTPRISNMAARPRSLPSHSATGEQQFVSAQKNIRQLLAFALRSGVATS